MSIIGRPLPFPNLKTNLQKINVSGFFVTHPGLGTTGGIFNLHWQLSDALQYNIDYTLMLRTTYVIVMDSPTIYYF